MCFVVVKLGKQFHGDHGVLERQLQMFGASVGSLHMTVLAKEPAADINNAATTWHAPTWSSDCTVCINCLQAFEKTPHSSALMLAVAVKAGLREAN